MVKKDEDLDVLSSSESLGICNPESFINDKQKFVPIETYNRDNVYTEFLDAYKIHYAEKSKQNRMLKSIFFIAVMATLVLFIGCIVTLVIVITVGGIDSAEKISTVIASLITGLTGIIVLPLIIARYLFPLQEDSDLLKFMTNILSIDKLGKATEKDEREKNDL